MPDELSLVLVECMDYNARCTEWALSAALESERITVARLEAENAELRKRLFRIQERVAWLLRA